MTEITPRQVLTVEGVAELLGLNPETVRRLLNKGELPGKRIGRRWYVRRVELEAMLTAERDPDIDSSKG